ncbi:MAG: fumarylacetoacetate hydrolase family protein [Bacteroidota bacterium]|nr:fumarylacetoacetate hydrolase family protein [Bacteroidota bacterium]
MKIICIGRNYADHAHELGNQVPKEPVVFLKPQSAILSHKHPFYIPEWTTEVHHEVELVVKIDRLGKTISEAHAPRYYSHVGLGIDFTARDVQSRLKKQGHPWERAKAFDGSAVVGGFVSLAELGKDIQSLQFSLSNHGKVVQHGHTSDMLFTVNRLISEVSKFMTLKVGDLLFTGTPSGVAPVKSGDRLVGQLEGHDLFAVNIK